MINKAKKNIVFIFIIFGVIFLLFFILLTPKNREKKAYKIILIPKTVDETNDFWSSLMAGAKLGSKDLNVDLKIIGEKSEENVKGQIKDIEESAKRKPDALIVAPSSYSKMSGNLETITDKGMKLVLIDSVVDKDIAESIVATNNFMAGKKLGELAKTLLNHDDEIGIVAHVMGASTAIERERGIKEGLGKYKDQIADTVFTGSSYDRAYTRTEEMLKKHSNIKVIIGTNEYSAVGAARAIKDQGLAEKVKIVGFDNSIEEIQMLEAGIFQGIVIQKPFNMGYLSIQQTVKILEGEPVEDFLDSGYKMITKDNMYEEENQRLLYPFTRQQ